MILWRTPFWLAGVLLAILSAHSLLVRPVPTSMMLLATLGFAAFAVVGVMLPRLGIFGDCVSRCTPRCVALTFDDGPHPETTREVLKVLAEYGQKATFFVVGEKVERYPDVVREIRAGGHELGVHGFEHDWTYCFKRPAAIQADVSRCQRAVFDACGELPSLLRPPLGMVSPRTAKGAELASVRLVGWSVRGLDGLAGCDPARALRRLRHGLRGGAVILLHDASEHGTFSPATTVILPELLQDMASRGLASARLSDALESRAPKRLLRGTEA